ncbi:MAG: DUF1080 domain-containing protein, partial [Acidobacteria bacterium]|nr:DUF1080 domain-containing protein [Acidobacteriota bacterium]
MKLHVSFPIAALVTVVCLACASDPAPSLESGVWRAWLDSPGGELPFGLELAPSEDGWSAHIINGPERIRVRRVDLDGDRLTLRIEHYDATIEATRTSLTTLDGRWWKTGKYGAISELPFHAIHGETHRFTPIEDAAKAGNAIHPRTNGWVIKSTILFKAGDGFVRSDHRYGDFVLELEWKALGTADSWDSGIYFRCDLPQGKRHWPSRYQINLKTHQEGNLIGFKGATNKGLAKAKDWNRFRLTVIGKNAALEINGKPAAEHIGATVEEEVIPHIADQITPVYERILRTGQPVVDLVVYGSSPSDPNVKRVWIVNHHPVKAEDGRILGITTVVKD